MNFTVCKSYFNKSPSNRIHWVELTVHKVLQKERSMNLKAKQWKIYKLK